MEKCLLGKIWHSPAIISCIPYSTLILRHHQNAGFCIFLLNEQAAPHAVPDAAKLGELRDVFALHRHVCRNIFVIDPTQRNGFYDFVRRFILYSVRPDKVL